jgi:uncharacterized protein YbcV (DUF1398 family)
MMSENAFRKEEIQSLSDLRSTKIITYMVKTMYENAFKKVKIYLLFSFFFGTKEGRGPYIYYFLLTDKYEFYILSQKSIFYTNTIKIKPVCKVVKIDFHTLKQTILHFNT